MAYLKSKFNRCPLFLLTESGNSDLFLSETHYLNELLQKKHNVSETHGPKCVNAHGNIMYTEKNYFSFIRGVINSLTRVTLVTGNGGEAVNDCSGMGPPGSSGALKVPCMQARVHLQDPAMPLHLPWASCTDSHP